MLPPCLSSLHAEYNIMRNTGSDEAQAGIEVAGRNTNPLRYANDTILMAEMKYRVGLQRVVFVSGFQVALTSEGKRG